MGKMLVLGSLFDGCLPGGLGEFVRAKKSEEVGITQSRRRQLDQRECKEGVGDLSWMDSGEHSLRRGAVDEIEENIVGSWLQVAAEGCRR
jgi:hypothetical protein